MYGTVPSFRQNLQVCHLYSLFKGFNLFKSLQYLDRNIFQPKGHVLSQYCCVVLPSLICLLTLNILGGDAALYREEARDPGQVRQGGAQHHEAGEWRPAARQPGPTRRRAHVLAPSGALLLQRSELIPGGPWPQAAVSSSRIHRSCTGIKASFKVGLNGGMTHTPL
jgi:hypothetical protein